MAMNLLEAAPTGTELGVEAAACLFKSLGDPSRVAIVQHLLLGEHRVFELTAHLGLAQSTVSAHLACLRSCGLVAMRPDGRASVYSLAFPEATAQFLRSAEELLRLTGAGVVLCRLSGASA